MKLLKWVFGIFAVAILMAIFTLSLNISAQESRGAEMNQKIIFQGHDIKELKTQADITEDKLGDMVADMREMKLETKHIKEGIGDIKALLIGTSKPKRRP